MTEDDVRFLSLAEPGSVSDSHQVPRAIRARQGTALGAAVFFVLMRLFALLVSVLPFTAQAECLDRSALDKGVLVTFSDASKTLIKRIDGNLLRVSTPPDWNNQSAQLPRQRISEAYFGFYVTRSEIVGFGGRVWKFEATPAAEPPEPKSGLHAESSLPPIDVVGRYPDFTMYTVSDGELLVSPVGQCRYETLVILTEIHLDDHVLRDLNELVYFPELGFGMRLFDKKIVSIGQIR